MGGSFFFRGGSSWNPLGWFRRPSTRSQYQDVVSASNSSPDKPDGEDSRKMTVYEDAAPFPDELEDILPSIPTIAEEQGAPCPGIPEPLSGHYYRTGYLYKPGKFRSKTWKKRFFVLDPTSLRVHRDEPHRPHVRPKYTFPIEATDLVVPARPNDLPELPPRKKNDPPIALFPFSYVKNNKSMRLAATSLTERTMWMGTLENLIRSKAQMEALRPVSASDVQPPRQPEQQELPMEPIPLVVKPSKAKGQATMVVSTDDEAGHLSDQAGSSDDDDIEEGETMIRVHR